MLKAVVIFLNDTFRNYATFFVNREYDNYKRYFENTFRFLDPTEIHVLKLPQLLCPR